MHLLELDNYNILIDCGLDYERNGDASTNEVFPFDPASIDVVILSHAHIDHSGNLPTLLRLGFEGQIICTQATAAIAELLMLDSVNIFLSKQRRKSKRSKKKHHAEKKPLYLQHHVMDTVERFVTIAYNKPFSLNGQISVTLIPVGHLLGAAAVIIDVDDHHVQKRIAFTGDIGRKGAPLLNDPQLLPQVDYLISESTYGGRQHSNDNLEQILIDSITDACIKTPGRLIIPAFSVGRTQALVYSLNRLFAKGILPKIKVFVDSPMARHSTEIYRKYANELSQEAQEFYQRSGDLFEFENLRYVESLEESRDISNFFEPCVIVSSAGMLEGGRIQDHLFQNLQNYYCTILFIGYSAKGTLGHRLLRGDPIIKLRNRELNVYASIRKTDSLSAHGDHDDLMDTIRSQSTEKLKNVFLVHGEEEAMLALQTSLNTEGYTVSIPQKGERIELA